MTSRRDDGRGETMAITLQEVLDFADRWFHTMMHHGSPAEQATFFADPHSRIYVLEGGETIGFEEHYKLHLQWTNERHRFGNFLLTVLKTSPERVRATGQVHWQAEYVSRPPPNVIKAVVGEDWIIERMPSGELKYVLYMNTFHHLLPDSAPLALE
jgi:hypothetical protein